MADSNALLAYIPSRLLELLRQDPAPYPNPPWEERFTGAVIFVDVSGFTPLSEVLTKAGSTGAEYLTDILNRSYEWLVAGVESVGGYVAHFNGDAITAVLPGESEDAVFKAAVHCGLDLIRAAYRHPPEVVGGADFPLRVKVGISAGSIYAAATGSHSEELRYFLAGSPVREAAVASSRCGPMELLVPKGRMDSLPPDVTTLEGPDDHIVVLPALLKRVPIPVPIRKQRPPAQPEDLPPLERLSRFVPAVINERLMLGLSDLVAEHRNVTVLFARFTGIEFDRPDCGARLQMFMAEVFERVGVHGGTIDKVEQADKGNLVMALFGAPRAVERAEEAAMACALELRDRFSQSDSVHVSQIGINSGLVYAGGLGSRWRYDYTVMGDAVNVAVRLMSAAGPREILVSERVQGRAPDWRYGEMRSLQLKGKAAANQVWPLLSRHQVGWNVDSDVIELPDRGDLLIGREAELYRLGEAIHRLRKGQPSVVLVEGEMGLGKTRLAEYVAGRVFDFGEVPSRPFRPQVEGPYGHWQGPLADLLKIERAGAEQRLTMLCQDIEPTMLSWISLFNPYLQTGFPETEVVANAEPTAREHKLQEMITSIFLHRAAQIPLLIVLDNFHDADNASVTLLRRLMSRLESRPLLLMILARSAPSIPLTEFPGLIHLTLAPLDKPRLRTLVEKLEGHQVSDGIHDLIWEKSQGNPLFTEELLHTLRQKGRLRRTASRVEAASPGDLEVPDNLRSLLQSRIDELPEACRAVAKVAAVIGARFTLPSLAAGFREELDPGFLQQQVETLIRARIIMPAGTLPSAVYEFRHVLSQEVVYSTMTQAQQEELHRRVGEHLEKVQGHVNPGALAHHFELGKDYPKAILYHIDAARQALNTYANDEAIRGYEKALTLADEKWLPLPENVSRAQILESLGDVYFRIGAYRKAEGLFRKVRGIAADWLSVVRCLRKEGEARCRGDDISNALRCFNEALLLLKAKRGWSIWGVGIPLLFRLLRDTLLGPPKGPGVPPRESERARFVEIDQVYAVLGIASFYEGSRRVFEAVFRMVEIARKLGEPPRIAWAYAATAFLYANLTFFGLARKYADAALEWLAREPDEALRIQMRATSTYSLVGAAARLATDWEQAEALQMKGLATSQAVGDVWEEGVALMNLANMWRTRGYHHRAIELHRRIMKLGRPHEPHLYLGEALVADGFCLAELGRFEEAKAQLERALALPALQIRSRVRAIAYRGWTRYLRGNIKAALLDLDQAARIISRENMIGEMVAEILTLRAEVVVASDYPLTRRWVAVSRAKRWGKRLPAMRGSLVFVRGLAAFYRGQPRRAAECFQKAATLHLAADRGREAARALLWFAHVTRDCPPAIKRDVGKLLRERGLPDKLPGGPPGQGTS